MQRASVTRLGIIGFACLVVSSTACRHRKQPAVKDEAVEAMISSTQVAIEAEESIQEIESKEKADLDQNYNIDDHFQHDEVQKWVEHFTKKDRRTYRRFLSHGMRYKPIIRTLLQKQNVPTFLFYLPLIESGYKNRARSHAGAVGVWQFMPATGRRYGLRISRYLDERRDPLRSTIAAGEYLKDLHNVFNSWLLAIAAYNAGPGRIMNAIMGHETRDFWELAKRRALPPETRAYIPKFLAAVLIGRDPARYGFDINPASELPRLMSAEVPSPIHLADLARITELPLSDLKGYNPHLNFSVTPPSLKTYRIWLPEHRSLSSVGLGQLKRLKVNQVHEKFTKDRVYRIRRGDSLISIAKRYGVSVATLRQNNNLRSNRIVAGRTLLIPRSDRNEQVIHYRVRPGDNLYTVARRFGTSVGQLKRTNALRHSTIYVGQVLRIRKS